MIPQNPRKAIVARVSIDDLAFAKDWIASYEADSDDGNGPARDRLCDWLQSEIDRRIREIEIRSAAKESGLSASLLRRALAARAHHT